MQKITLTILLSLLFCLFADFLKASDTITVQLTTSSPNPANTPQFEILIQFSDSVDDLDIADIVVENGYLADLRIGNSYRLQWTAKIWAFNEGWIKIYMPANATYRFPDYQVGNTASDTLILYFDNSKPRPILSSLAQTPTKNPEFDVSVQFTEYVVNFDPNDIVYTNSEIISIEEIEPGRSYKYIFRALVDGFAEVHMPSQICTDQAGNVNYSSNTISVKFDTRPPGAVLTAYPDTLVNLLNYTFRVTFDESVTGLDSADFVMHNATFKSLVVVKDKEIWDVTITHLADGHAWVYLKDNTVIDLLENSNTGTDTIFWRYDGTPPTTQLTTYHKQITNSDTVWFYVAFSEPVYYFTTASISASRGVVSNLSQMGDIQHYKFMITTAPYDWHEIFIKSGGAADKARNSNVSSNKIIIYTDKIHPSVVLSSPETNPTNEDSFRAFLTFSEKTYGIDSTDFYLQKCKVSNLYTEDSILFSFNIHPLVNGIISMNLPAGVGADHIGNLNTASLFYSIEYDTIRPRMTIYSPTGNFQHAEFTARFKFDETVQGFGDTSISIINGTFKNFTMSASQTEWQVTVVPNKIGEVIVSARENAVLDKAGNRSTKPTDLIVSYNNDSFQPKVVLSSNTPSPTASSEIEVIMTFSEPVFGLTISKIRTQNATVSNLRMIENDSLWSVKVYPGTDGYIKIWLDAQTVYDAAQNYSTASNTLTWLVDLSAPGLNISTTAPDTGNIQQISVRFVFTEEITGLDSSDLKCTNMNLVSLTSSSTLVYSAIFQIIADGDASIWVTEQSVIDLVGNANTPSNVIQLYYDGTRPQAFISSYHAKDTIYTDTLTIRVTFSEKIDGFSFNNLQLFNAQVVGMNYDPVLKAYDITLQALDSLQFGITAKVPSGVSYDKWNNPNLASDVYVKYLNFGPNAINSRDLPPGWRIGSGYEVIRIESPAHNGNAQLEIFDLQMRSILSYQMESSETKNIQIMNGVYFIRITQDKFEYGKMLIVR